jgi:hypothetical protein
MKVITVHDTPPYGHAPTYQISLTYLERQTCYGPDKKILFKKQLFDLIHICQTLICIFNMNVLFKCDSRTYLFVCVLLNVQRCISHVYSGQEQVPQIYSQEEGIKQPQ